MQKAKPGQFVILRANEYAERIPMSIAGLDKQKGILTIVVLEVGKSTAFLGTLETGDFILDLFGPLGQPTEMGKHGTVVCVGGGIGIAPLYPLIQGYKTDGNRVITIIGARSKNLLIKENELGAVSDEIICTTDDGSYGMKGLVTDALKKVIDREKVGLVMAVGPVVMMRAISDLTKKSGIKTIVSLNPLMVDGAGMCGGCRVVIEGKNKFACVDGPDFDAHLVDFDNLTMRQRAYQAEERLSYEAYQCKALNSVKVV